MADNYVGISIKATDGAKPALDDLKLKLDQLKDRVATARADVSTAEADAQLTDLEAKLEAANKKIASPRIDVAGAARANAQITAVEAEMDKLDAKATESAAVQKESAGGMAAAGDKTKLALLGIAVGAGVAIKGAADFQAQTTRLVTSAGELPQNLAKVQQGMLGISAQTATSTSEMATGMYTVESAGFHGAQGLVVLKAAAQGAKDEGAELGTVANAVTDILVDYHMKASDSATATSQLVKAVSFGKTNFEEFSGSMSTILPLASSLHLKLSDVTGVLAEMTAHGMNARQAADDEANAMRELAKPNAAMVKEFTALGISSDEVYKKLGTAGLGGTMQWLSGIAQKGAAGIGQNYTQALGKLMGTAPGLSVALMTTGKNADETNKAIQGIAGASADAQGNVEGFGTVSQTMAFKMQAAEDSIKAAGISLGSALLPAVTAVLGPITKFLQLIASNKVAADGFALVIGGVLAGALGGKLAGAFRDMKAGIEGAGKGLAWLIAKITGATVAQEAQTAATEAGTVAQTEMDAAMDANPIGLIILAIAALVAVIVLVVTHLHFFAHAFDEVRHAVAEAGHDVAAWFDRIRHDVAAAVDAVVSFVKQHWQLLLGILLGPIALAAMEIVKHWNTIKSDAAKFTHDVTSTVSKFASDVLHFFENMFTNVAAAERRGISIVVADVKRWFSEWLSDTESGLARIVSWFEGLPGRILHALGNMGSLLVNAGRSLIEGLIHGVESMGSSLVGSIENLIPGPIKSVVSSALGIFSPSKVFHSYGQNIVQGLVNGVEGSQPQLRSTMQRMSATVAGSGAGVSAAGVAGGGNGKVQLEFATSGDDFVRWLRKTIRTKGGNVQAVLGAG